MNPKAATESIDKAAVRIAYDDAVVSVARLAAFATADFKKASGFGIIQSRSALLAQTDIILLAISVRRLAELCNLKSELKQSVVSHVRPMITLTKADFYPIRKKINLWALIGVVLHHLTFQVFKSESAVKGLLGEFKDDVVEAYDAIQNDRDILAVCFMKSDKGEAILFSVAEFAGLIVEFLEVAEENLSDLGIYVGSYVTD